MSTSGFYKNENGIIVHGPNFVEAGSYSLYRQSKDTYTYPVDGWYWFDTMEEAYSFFGLVYTEQPQQTDGPVILPPNPDKYGEI